jgi:16S rRNA (guanine966-N2)-methyltransferase
LLKNFMLVVVEYVYASGKNIRRHPITSGATFVMTSRPRDQVQAKPKTQGQVRIIGGRWRGRKLSFTASDGLRPTPDRVRETLFNWLAAETEGARCLDLFAGSGALGLEALSRGAGSCHFVDASALHCQQIQQHLGKLEAGSGVVECREAIAFLDSHREAFDLVFLDPPFGEKLIDPCCSALLTGGLLTPGATLYIEVGIGEPAPQLPEPWHLYRDKRAGQVSYRLYRRIMG